MNQNIFNEYPDVITIQDIQKLLRISRHAAGSISGRMRLRILWTILIWSRPV